MKASIPEDLLALALQIFSMPNLTMISLRLAETLAKIDRETARRFFRIRHLTKRGNGLIVTIVICHRLHGIPIEFRTEPDYILFKSLPIGYDKSVVKRFVGNRGIRYLQEIIMNNDRSKTLVYDYRRDEAQTIELPLANRNYLRTLYPRKVRS